MPPTTSSSAAASSTAAADPTAGAPTAGEQGVADSDAGSPALTELEPHHDSGGGFHPAVRGGLALWALFVGFAMLMVGNGLNLAVIGVRVVGEGFGVRTSGYVMACYFAGFLVGPVIVVKWLSSVGHIRVFASLASVASVAVLVHSVSVTPITWALMRFVFGFCMAGLYVVVESWLNDASTPANRGRTLAFYMVVSMGGLAVGQLLIATADPGGFTLFIVASILVSLSFVPMALAATTDAPAVRTAPKLSVRELVRNVPTGAVGTFFTGASQGILFSLGAVYATRAGFGATETAAFIAVPAIGALVFQWPIGWLSDRYPRRGVIFVVAVAATAVCVILALLPEGHDVVIPVTLLLGGLTFPLYSLLLTYTLDWSPPGTAIGASGAMLRVNGAGAVLGPIVTASAMGELGEQTFFWSMMVTHGVIVAFVAYRLAAREGLPLELQGRFVPVPARATDLAVRLAARPLRASRAKLRRNGSPGPSSSP